jgi:hypothetical protein
MRRASSLTTATAVTMRESQVGLPDFVSNRTAEARAEYNVRGHWRSLISPNDEVERRGVALTQNEADLSQSSTPFLGLPKMLALAIARTDC